MTNGEIHPLPESLHACVEATYEELEEMDFWERVYIALAAAGSETPALGARMAVVARREFLATQGETEQ